jgi:hypothetical protein
MFTPKKRTFTNKFPKPVDIFDLFLTPVYLLLIYGIAKAFRNKVTTTVTRKYYMPALAVKLIGAIALGVIYQFYYGGGKPSGDTFHYFYHAKIIFQAFLDSPVAGLKLLVANGEFDNDTYTYAARMPWYRATTEYFVIKIAGFFGLIGFNTYTVTSLFFALISFSGMWAMYLTFLKLYPRLHKEFAIAVFFLPSVFFWGSGLMKDTLTIGALGWLFFGFYRGAIEKKKIISSLIIILISAFVIKSVKVYVLLAFLPPALLWIFAENSTRIRNRGVRLLIMPLLISMGAVAAYFGTTKLTEGDVRYDIDNIGERTKINAEYLYYQTLSQNGSAYHIGDFDGSIGSMLKVAPQAVIVSLFRPFLWEVRNPVMLLSALEALLFLYLTVMIIFRTGLLQSLKFVTSKPIVTFCFVYSLVLAFAVGTNSFNFGTLVRYKIPLMPFYLSALYMMRANVKARIPKMVQSGKSKRPPFQELPKPIPVPPLAP